MKSRHVTCIERFFEFDGIMVVTFEDRRLEFRPGDTETLDKINVDGLGSPWDYVLRGSYYYIKKPTKTLKMNEGLMA